MEIGRCSDDGLSNCVPLHDYTPSTRWGYDGLRLLSDDEQVQEIQRAEEGLTIPPCEDQTCPQGWKSGKIFWINAESSQLASSTGKLSHFTNHLTTGIEISPWGRGINFLSRIASGWSCICPCSQWRVGVGMTCVPMCCLSWLAWNVLWSLHPSGRTDKHDYPFFWEFWKVHSTWECSFKCLWILREVCLYGWILRYTISPSWKILSFLFLSTKCFILSCAFCKFCLVS